MTRVVGLFFQGPEEVFEYVVEVSGQTFPEIAPELLRKLKVVVAKPLEGSTTFTLINSLVLVVSCLTFFNSLWSGLFLMSEDKMFLSWKRHLIAFGLLGLLVLVVFFSFLLQPVFRWFNLPLGYSLWQFLVFWSSFSIAYYWLLRRKGKKREALIASGTFVILLIVSKNLFWLYIRIIQDSVTVNYGEYYLGFMGALWIFFLMNLFFYGLSLCIVMRENSPFDSVEKGKLES